MTEWHANEANNVVFFPAGDSFYGWRSLVDLLKQMGWLGPINATPAVVNNIVPENPIQPKWVIPKTTDSFGRAIIVDIWGVVVPWEAVGVAISNTFQNGLINRFSVKPLGFPPNIGLLTTSSEEESVKIIKMGSMKIGNGVLCFQRWAPSTIKLIPSTVSGNRWIRILGLPLNAWKNEVFKKIGDYCGKFLTVDSITRSKTMISYARILVEVESINQIHRHMVISLEEVDFDLLVEVEMGLGHLGSVMKGGNKIYQGAGGVFGEDAQELLDLGRVRVSISAIESSSDKDTIGIKGKGVMGAGKNEASKDNFKPKSNSDHLSQGGPSNDADQNLIKPGWVWKPKLGGPVACHEAHYQ